MAVRAVFFDIGGVVVSANLERYAERASPLFRTDPELLRTELAKHVRELERGEISSFQFWTRIGEGLESKSAGRTPKPQKFMRIWRNLMLDSIELNLPLLQLCQALARKGLIVGVISNTIADHAEILADLGVYVPFSPCVLSCQVAMRKPDPEIYLHATRLAGVLPSQCLLVDDTVHNLLPARELGYQTHHYVGLDPLLQSLRKMRLSGDFEPPPALSIARVVHVPDQLEPSEEPPERSRPPSFQGPPCDLRQDPWLTGEAEFPWGHPLDEQLRFLMGYAVLAPSHHNTQPWWVRVDSESIEILGEPERCPSDILRAVSCGWSLFQLRLALRFFGLEPVRETLEAEGPRIRLEVAGEPGLEAWERLTPLERMQFRAIPYVRMVGGAFAGSPVVDGHLEALGGLQNGPDVRVDLLADPAEKQPVAEVAVRAASERWLDPGYRKELAGWLHADPARADGVPRQNLGLGWWDSLFLQLLLSRTGSFGCRHESRLASEAPLLALISTTEDLAPHRIRAGEAAARLALTARVHGLGCSLISHPIELPARRKELADRIEGRVPQVLLRFGYAHNMSPEPRRPRSEVLR
ncbi:MAG: HAD-IA family hydrolase [Armatimonadetes bacterium]|nr:HAD-IA family hydrolase [Armatimonadota bacterium]